MGFLGADSRWGRMRPWLGERRTKRTHERVRRLVAGDAERACRANARRCWRSIEPSTHARLLKASGPWRSCGSRGLFAAARQATVRGGGGSMPSASERTHAKARAQNTLSASGSRDSRSNVRAAGACFFVTSKPSDNGSWLCSPQPHESLHAARPCALRSPQQQLGPSRSPHAQLSAAFVPQHEPSPDSASSIASTEQHDAGLAWTASALAAASCMQHANNQSAMVNIAPRPTNVRIEMRVRLLRVLNMSCPRYACQTR
jgi:hypothetical protein